jgi:hypothetical protein
LIFIRPWVGLIELWDRIDKTFPLVALLPMALMLYFEIMIEGFVVIYTKFWLVQHIIDGLSHSKIIGLLKCGF